MIVFLLILFLVVLSNYKFVLIFENLAAGQYNMV